MIHGQRYLPGQRLQSEHWLDAREGDLIWCTASTDWSKSARNSFIAPWLRGASALMQDARFDPAQRLALLAEEHVNVLCMAPTEYRMIAKRLDIEPVPGLRTLLKVIDGELALADPATDPTFFVAHPRGPRAPSDQPWLTGDRVTADEDGDLYFEGRSDDLIISARYRIGPFEVESALLTHPAVAEAAVVAHPDDERGSVVRAVVVTRGGVGPSDGLAAELQDHVKRETAPYKYPRIVDFADELPKTSSGKVQRALLRASGNG